MPHEGPYRTGSIYLGDRQAYKFSNPALTGATVRDRLRVRREVCSGIIDQDEENYGLFEGGRLIASLSLNSPAQSATDCPTAYWSVGMIEVAHEHQGKRLGPRLLDAVFHLRGSPLASDLDQDGGGADLWRRWIKKHPGCVELHDPNGIDLGVVVKVSRQRYHPPPWAVRATRLVRQR